MSDTQGKTRWHTLLGRLYEYLLPRLGIDVQVDPKLMSEPPRGDIILLRREGDCWTEEQKAYLADGIRDSIAAYILLEFKYTESINQEALQQTLAYEYFYRQTQQLHETELDCFLISAKTPQAKTLKEFGYVETDKAGVYRTHLPLFKKVTLISVNDLANTEYNAWLRCFASKKAEKQKAFERVHEIELKHEQVELYRFIQGLYELMFGQLGELAMKFEVTPEDVEMVSQFFKGSKLERSVIKIIMREELTPEERLEGLTREDRLNGLTSEDRLEGLTPEDRLEGLTPEDRLEGLTPEDRLEGLTPEDRLEGLTPEDRLEGLTPEDRLEGLTPEDRLEGLTPEDRLEGLTPEDRLEGLTPEAIEAYLKKIKRTNQPS